jgi:hypothetical protein
VPREEQGMPVRSRSSHRLGADGAGRARLVHHQDLLTVEIARCVLRKVARGEVGVAARGVRNDERDLAARGTALVLPL